ncbi:MAG: ring-cleaving dioxygenase, partial [Armatimonadota bacterium]
AFSIPERAAAFWQERLSQHGIAFEGPRARFDEQVFVLQDPDGLPLELIAYAGAEARTGWQDGPVPAQHAIRGFYGITLAEKGHGEGCEQAMRFLSEGLGFRLVRESGNRFQFAMGAGGPGALVDVLCLTGAPQGQVAAGTVHHVAWRTPDDANQAAWQERIAGRGVSVTDVRDRQYFRSIYFREPGGVLFEIATDPPGFTRDESVEQLGTRLMLPPWLEPRRGMLERSLPRLTMPPIS